MKLDDSRWLGIPDELNSYWLFDCVFSGEESEATLELAADREVEVCLNGELLPFSQLADMPPAKSVTTWPVRLKSGSNRIAVLLHCSGRSFFTYNATGRHGLAAIIYGGDGRVFCTTGTAWRYMKHPAFIPVTANVTSQLGLTYEYDARKAIDWRNLPLPDEAKPAEVDEVCPWHFKPRDVPALISRPIPSSRICQTGFLLRTKTDGTPAEQCQADLFRAVLLTELFDIQLQDGPTPERGARFCSPHTPLLQMRHAQPGTNGAYVTFDMGREMVGFIDFTIVAPAGTVIDIAYGEHLDDGRVRAALGGRNFADRYICAAGMNRFCYRHRRLGTRYVELHITGCELSQIAIGYVRLDEQLLPLPPESQFACDDSLLLKSREVAINTLLCCMHEHYEDCPWREQSLYAYDSRNQILYGFYVWGNYKFAEAALNLLGDNYFKDGQLAITSPSNPNVAICSFTLVWIAELYELWLYSGSSTHITRNRDTILKVIDYALALKDTPTGLYYPKVDKQFWNFFEWVPGLDFGRGSTRPEFRLNACYNAYLLEALDCANAFFNARYCREADALRLAIRNAFQDGDSGYFRTINAEWPLHQHTQALMLFNHVVVPGKDINATAKFMHAWEDRALVPVSFSAMAYYMRAWMEVSPEARRCLERMVRDEFEPMLFEGATSYWERGDGGDAFYFAGSLCHGWSSLPAYYCHRYVLGVAPLEPGFQKFLVKPYPGSLPRARGTVPTPAGDIAVEWELREEGLQLQITTPAGLTPVIDAYPEFPVATYKVSTK